MTGTGMEYFDAPGEVNTERTLERAKARGAELGIDTFVVASSRGITGLRAAEYLRGSKVIVVRTLTGYREPNVQAMSDDVTDRILALGAKVHTATHGYAGLGRAVRFRFGSYQVDEIISETLRVLGVGVKVACEVASMAADAGLIRTDEDVIAIGGGADTAVVLKPSNVHNFFEMKVREIICKPRDW